MSYKTYDNNHYQNTTPPGIVKLSNGLMMDETEVTNFHWCEYMYWTKRVFGKNSPEYSSTIPDTNCWIKSDTSYLPFTKYYLKRYRDYPVVGITQKQVETFSKWRSDRVFEYILIGSGILKWQTDLNPENYFTPEKYFRGEHLGIKPDSNHLYYPVYTLPTVKEWKYAEKYSDSLMNERIIKQQSKIFKKSPEYYNFIHCGYAGVKFIRNIYINDPFTVPVYSGFPLYNLKGNISEWTTSSDTTIGGGWYHTRAEILYDTIFICDTSNAWTGFRNVVHWEKWEK
jgi:hypothetical protein